jgi:hypothetical protein
MYSKLNKRRRIPLGILCTSCSTPLPILFTLTMIFLKGLIICMLKFHTYIDEVILVPVISYSFKESGIILCEILGPNIRDFNSRIFTYMFYL